MGKISLQESGPTSPSSPPLFMNANIKFTAKINGMMKTTLHIKWIFFFYFIGKKHIKYKSLT